MAFEVGVNTWVTIVEADDYLALKRGADNWATLTTNTKQQNLVTAFRWILDSKKFNVSASTVNDVVDRAQIELAWYIEREYENHQDRTALQSQGVKKFELKDWEEDYSHKADLPDFIYDILEDFIVGQGLKGFEYSRDLSPNRGGGD